MMLRIAFFILCVMPAMPGDNSASGVPQSATDVLVKLYTDTAERLSKIVLNPPGGTQASQDYARARAAVQLTQIKEIVAGLDKAAAAWIGTNLGSAMAQGIALAQQQATAAGISGGDKLSPKGSFALIDPNLAKVFAQEIYSDLTKASGSMVDQAESVLTKTAQQGLSEIDINKILAGGAIEGKPVQAIKELKDALKKTVDGKVTVINKNGDTMEFDAGYYAKLVAVTKTRQAAVASRHNRLEKLGLDLVAITGALSGNFCTAYLGQVFSISGKSDKYPGLDELPGGGPPFHPNCSKGTRPFVEELSSDAQLARADGIDDAEKFLGIDAAEAQRRFKDLQGLQQVEAQYK